jgi:hypothetical protein
MDWSTPWKTLSTVVDSAQKAFDELEESQGTITSGGNNNNDNLNSKTKSDSNKDSFFDSNVTPIAPSSDIKSMRRSASNKESLQKKNNFKNNKTKDDDAWWLNDDHVQKSKKSTQNGKSNRHNNSPSPTLITGTTTNAKRKLKISTPNEKATSNNANSSSNNKNNNNSIPSPTVTTPINAKGNDSDNKSKPATPKSTLQLKQQNDKLKKNLQKAIQAAKDARGQRQKLMDQMKNMRAEQANFQSTIQDQSNIITEIEERNNSLIKQNQMLQDEVKTLKAELVKSKTNNDQKRVKQVKDIAAKIESTNELNIGNNNETKGTLLNDSTVLSIKATKQKKQSKNNTSGVTNNNLDESQLNDMNESSVVIDTTLLAPDHNDKIMSLKEELNALKAERETEEKESIKKIKLLEESLEKREEQLEKIAITTNTLNAQVLEYEQTLATKSEEYESLQINFQTLQTEYTTFKNKMNDTSNTTSKLNVQIVDLQNELNEEKDKRALLMEEGVALSKKQAAMESTIKQLKSSNTKYEQKYNDVNDEFVAIDARMKAMQKKLQLNNLKMAENEAKCDERESQIKKITAEHNKLKGKHDALVNENNDLKSSLETSIENLKNESINVRTLTTELGEYKQKQKESNEHLNEHSNIAIEMKEKEEAQQQNIESLQNAINDIERTNTERENKLLAQIKKLKEKNEISERRNEDLSAEATNATKPLLRQIRTLQTLHEERGRAWDSAEEVLTQRLASAEGKLVRAETMKRNAEQKLNLNKTKMIEMEETSRICEEDLEKCKKDLEQYIADLKQVNDDKETVQMQYNTLKTENDNCVKSLNQLQNEYDFTLNEKLNIENELSNTQKDFNKLKTTLNEQRLEYDNLKKVQQAAAKLAFAVSGGENIDEMEENEEGVSAVKVTNNGNYTEQQELLSNVVSSISTHSNLDYDADNNNMEEEKEDEDLLRILEAQGNGPLRISIHSLRRTMRQRRNYMNNMKKQLRTLENERNKLSQQLLHTKSLEEKLNKYQSDYDILNNEYAATKKKQFVLLELLGEKDEEVAELNDNILTMKTMYRQQTNELLTRIETLQGKQQ